MKPTPRLGITITSDSGRTVVLALDEPCVCGSGRRFERCCRTIAGLAVRPAGTKPRSPQTGLVVAGCYAGALRDCSGRLSKEHYLSKTLQKAFAKAGTSRTIRVRRPGKHERNVVPEQALHERILCQRHNSALHELDTTAERLFAGIREGEGKPAPSYTCRAVNGASLERWMLKATCGVLAAEGEPVPPHWLRVLFGSEELTAPLGLYMHVHTAKRLVVDQLPFMEFGIFRDTEGVSGAVVTLDTATFTLDLRGKHRTVRPNELGSTRILRPLGIWFEHAGTARFYVLFDWGSVDAAQTSLVVDLQHPYSAGRVRP